MVASPEHAAADAPALDSARGGAFQGIKRALSFNSKKKRRPQQVATRDSAASSDRSDSSGPATPSPSSPPETPHIPPVKLPGLAGAKQQGPPTKAKPKGVRRTLSWTRRASKHMAAEKEQSMQSAA